MRRRDFIAVAGAIAASKTLPARAQQGKTPKLGILLAGKHEPFSKLFWEGMRELGYTEGQNIQAELRSAEGVLERLPALAAELVGANVDLIVASETPSVQAAQRATGGIPIVMAPAGDPVASGLVASLARPGGNVTGLSAATAVLAGKSLELFREILPGIQRVAVLAHPTNPFTRPFLEQIEHAAFALRLAHQTVMVRGEAEYEAGFAELAARHAEAVIMQPTLPHVKLAELALKRRLPSVSGNRTFVEAGGLMSYAGSLADRYRNAAPYVDRLLKGAKPAELPVQQPARFEIVINQKTARAIGLTLPSTLLARADEVIE
jgi:putative ABC transport system substrate-binding protein